MQNAFIPAAPGLPGERVAAKAGEAPRWFWGDGFGVTWWGFSPSRGKKNVVFSLVLLADGHFLALRGKLDLHHHSVFRCRWFWGDLVGFEEGVKPQGLSPSRPRSLEPAKNPDSSSNSSPSSCRNLFKPSKGKNDREQACPEGW